MKPRINLPFVQTDKPSNQWPDQVTPPLGPFDPPPLNRRQRSEQATISEEDTDKYTAVNSDRTTFTDDKNRAPSELLFAAIIAHILQRIDKQAPSQVFVSDELLFKLTEEAKSLSLEGFTEKYFFSNPWDGGTAAIAVGRDYMLGYTLPVNQAVCVHNGG